MTTAPLNQTIAVKPLEWHNHVEPPFIRYARSSIGSYRVQRGQVAGSGWWFHFNGMMGAEGYSSEEEAEVAAQADYSARILSAIDPAILNALSEATSEIERLKAERDESDAMTDALVKTVERAEAERDAAVGALKKERHRATNAEYLVTAYRNMLGDKGLEVAKLWTAKGVVRIHFDWGPDAWKLTGEQRAEFILGIEQARTVEGTPGSRARSQEDAV